MLSPDIQWVDDGTLYADNEQIRERFTRGLIDLLDRFQLEYDMVTGLGAAQRPKQLSGNLIPLLD